VLVYGGILGAIVAGLVTAMVLRVPLKVDVIRDRGALAREVYDDKGHALVENVYRLQVMNTAEQRRTFTISAEGIDDLELDSERTFEVAPATTVSIPLRLRAPATLDPGSHRIYVQVHAVGDDGVNVREKTTFLGLRR
jgi:polyferredoxin